VCFMASQLVNKTCRAPYTCRNDTTTRTRPWGDDTTTHTMRHVPVSENAPSVANVSPTCRHYFHRIPTDICECSAEEYPHLHGECCLCHYSRTFKHYDVPEFGIAYVTGDYGEMLTAKRKAGQQAMRESIALGARPGQRWSK